MIRRAIAVALVAAAPATAQVVKSDEEFPSSLQMGMRIIPTRRR